MRSSNTNLTKRKAEAGRREIFFRYFLLFVMLLFSIYQYGVHRLYGFSVYPDEFGYWAIAAQWVGYDWSEAASLGSYYSFGYSLILAPILMFCRNAVTAYRAAVAVNMILQCISAGLLWGIFRRLSGPTGGPEGLARKMGAVSATGIAVFYPVWTFYMQTTLTESLLAFLYVLICYQFILLFENKKIWSVVISAGCLSLSFLFLYYIHMRTVGVVIAAAATMILYLWHRPAYRKVLFAGICILIGGAAAGMWIKGYVTGTVYAAADTGVLSRNDYAGQIASVRKIFTGPGMIQFLQSCAGKLYYLGMASFGLFLPAAAVCIKKTARLFACLFRKRTEETENAGNWLSFFLLFSMLGQFFVTAVFTSSPGRLDGIFYGRYNEYLLPVFMGIGVLLLLESRRPWKILLINIGILAVLFGITLYTALQSDADLMYGFFAAGISYLSGSMYSWQALPELVKSFLFGLFLMAFVTGAVYMSRNSRWNICMTGMLLLMEILLTICLSSKYTWHFNDTNYYDLKLYEYIDSYEAEHQDVPVSYLYGGGVQYIDLIQFAMQGQTIEILREKDASGNSPEWESLRDSFPEEGFLIVDSDSGYLEELEKNCRKCKEGYSFVLFWTE